MTGMRGRTRAGLIGLVGLLAVVLGVVLVVLRPWADSGRATADDPPPDRDGGVTIVAAGDIGRCNAEGDEATAALVEGLPDATVLALGDLAYDSGSAEDFERCYDTSWGPFAERTYAVPGNHEYRSAGATPYFDYFGDRVGEPGKGWYSFDLGQWHVVALNSNCEDVGCAEGSEQHAWLRADLAADDASCTLAFWHHPRFSSGARHGGTDDVEDLFQLLVDDRAEVLLTGHEHLYERTAPLDGDGAVAQENGVREFVVGTGGGNFYPVGERIPGSEVVIEDTNGVLRMTLGEDGYDWEFLPVTGDAADAGSAECR